MSLDSLLSRVYDLPSIPKVVQDLMASFNNPKTDVAAVSRNIQSDPVIAAKVLRLANSVRYGAGRKVSSIDSAVVMLGFETLKTLVIASGITGTFKSIPGLDVREFWRNSFMVANICKLVAKNARGLEPETAFTCGMLHNICVALLHLVHPNDMQKILADVAGGKNRNLMEKIHFGFDNHELAARLASLWRFPELIQHALAHQGNPLAAKPFSPYAIIIHLAQIIRRGYEDNLAREEIMASLPEALTAPLHLNTFSLFEQLTTLYDAEDDIEDLLAA
ncbi:MAG TPA: HDOD domain-containing protein [Dongiaceae bacterium]|nr:HDOD domain-containing protein [Dongiaceae bacterium]